MGFFRRLSILAPFALRGVSVKAFERNINLVRILFGLGLVHRYVDMLGYSVVSGRPESMIDHSILSIVFSVMIALGFLTPVGLIGLNVIYFIPKFFVPYLGTQVAIVVCWGLLFFGAGRRYSIDAMLSDFIPVLRKPLRIVYTFAIEPGAGRYISEQATAWVRFVSIASYWGICYVAMAFHFRDALWLDGRVLQTAFTTSYLTDFYGIFRYMAEAYPTLFDIFFTTALLVQGIWETFLLPLMFFRWGRVFVVIQGTGFFLVSFFFLNLGYLPYIELCMLVLLFNYSSSLFLRKGVLSLPAGTENSSILGKFIRMFDFYDCIEMEAAPSNLNPERALSFSVKDRTYTGFAAVVAITRNIAPFFIFWPVLALLGMLGFGESFVNFVVGQGSGKKSEDLVPASSVLATLYQPKEGGFINYLKSRIIRPLVVTACCTAVALFFFFCPVNPLGGRALGVDVKPFYAKYPFQMFVRTFGQAPVSVFNHTDLGMGNSHMVIFETDQNGKFKRLVPFMDIEGGRLDYLRNDLLYFTESLKWQRLRGEPKFIGNDPSKPGYRTIRLANLVALLDACLTGMNHPRTYKALVFFRKRKQVQRFEVWDAAQLTSEMDLNIDQNTINKYQNRWECKNAFELPPGHFGSRKREQETIAKIQELQAERSMVADARS